MPTAYTLPTTLFVLSFLFFLFVAFMYWPVIYAFFKGTPVDYPIAKKPTKSEIAERNHIDWLMMPEEMEENPIINLHETEKAIS